MRFDQYVNPGRVESCKPDCPQRSMTCHGKCPAYMEAKQRAAEINERYRKERELNNALQEIENKNKEKFGRTKKTWQKRK